VDGDLGAMTGGEAGAGCGDRTMYYDWPRAGRAHSDVITEMIAWLERIGVRVVPYAHDLPCAGMYRSETETIYLNEPTAYGALMTLAHEAGHHLGYLICEKEHSYQRERQAFAYGWHVLKWFGAQVTRRAWIRQEQDRRMAPAVATEHLFGRHDV
jgi:hypothetical protein